MLTKTPTFSLQISKKTYLLENINLFYQYFSRNVEQDEEVVGPGVVTIEELEAKEMVRETTDELPDIEPEEEQKPETATRVRGNN